MTDLTKKFATLAATLMLALIVTTVGVTTVQVNQAQAGKGGRIAAGVILGAAALAIIASEGRRAKAHGHYYKHRSHGKPWRRHRICYDRWGDPYRCYKKRKYRRHWRRNHRRHHNHW